MARLVIAPLRPKDQEAARQLVLAGLAEHWGWLDPTKNPDLDDLMTAYQAGVFLVAWQADEIVGTGAFLPRSADTVEIVRMSVRRDRRRQGIGRAILQALCREAQRRGYRRVILETTATWHDAVAFYQALGFCETHRTEGNVYFTHKVTACA